MRVTRHDARTSFHAIGIQPDVPVTPTIAGLRGGRDEVLEKALAIVLGGARTAAVKD
jgi:C-terminal processing protease CtpA/Prc